jgi:hypothetical protein
MLKKLFLTKFPNILQIANNEVFILSPDIHVTMKLCCTSFRTMP